MKETPSWTETEAKIWFHDKYGVWPESKGSFFSEELQLWYWVDYQGIKRNYGYSNEPIQEFLEGEF